MIEHLEHQLKLETGQTARWRELHQGAMKTIQEQYVELMELRPTVGNSADQLQEAGHSTP